MSGILKLHRFWQTSMALVCLLLLNANGLLAEPFNWRKFEGTTLRVLENRSAFTPIVKEQIREFEKLTGITVKDEQYPSDPLRKKVIMELGARNQDLDVFQGMCKTAFQYAAAGWLEPLDDYINNPALTNPDYDFADFFEASQLRINGQLIGISSSANPQVLIYRKDLFEQYGIAVPTNWQELEAAAKTLKANLDQGTFAWIARMNNENSAPFSAFLHTNNASWLDAAGNPAFNEPKAIEALEFYGRMAREYGPPGASGIGWKEVVGAIAQGKAAMTVEISIFAGLVLENPKQSKVVGKLGYALVPPGVPGNYKTMLPLNMLHISALSNKKEAAWYYIQFMSGKEPSMVVQLLGLPATRKSSWEDPRWKAKDKLPELTRIQIEGFKTGLTGFEIPIAQFTEARPAIQNLIYTAYEGGDVKKKADEAVAEVRRMLR
jgi:multiple sugar transport system substrate-binding protein